MLWIFFFSVLLKTKAHQAQFKFKFNSTSSDQILLICQVSNFEVVKVLEKF